MTKNRLQKLRKLVIAQIAGKRDDDFLPGRKDVKFLRKFLRNIEKEIAK